MFHAASRKVCRTAVPFRNVGNLLQVLLGWRSSKGVERRVDKNSLADCAWKAA
jgi:hypothetical protein